MKLNLKKLAAVALSSLGILTAMPSAFCSKEMKNSKKLRLPHVSLSHKPKKNTKKPKIVIVNMPNQIISLPEHGDLFPNRYSGFLFYGQLTAPYASGTAMTAAFRNQSKLTSISLPLIQAIENYAFEGCNSLETIILTENLKYIYPKAFEGCNPNVKINFEGYDLTISEFLKCCNIPQQ